MKQIVGLLAWILLASVVILLGSKARAADANPAQPQPAPATSNPILPKVSPDPAKKPLTMEDLPAHVQVEVKRLQSPDPQQRAAGVTALGKMKKDAQFVVPLLINMLADNSLWPDVAQNDPWGLHVGGVNVPDRASAALVDLGALAVPQLTNELTVSSNQRIRLGAAKVLGKIKDPRAIVPLIMALKDPDWQVVSEAAASLNAIDHPSRVDALLLAIQDKSAQVRITATQILGATSDSRAVQPLIQALKDSHPEVRRLAAAGLVRLKDPNAAQPLLEAMRDNNIEVQRTAADTLAQIRNPVVVPGLIEMLKDKDEQIRISSASTLGRLRDQRAREPLIELLHDPKAAVRLVAIQSLASSSDWQVAPALVELLNDSSLQVQRAAGEALTNLRDPAAVPALIAMLKNGTAPKARSYAAQLLGVWRAQEALDALREAAEKDASYDVKVEAAKAIRRISIIQK